MAVLNSPINVTVTTPATGSTVTVTFVDPNPTPATSVASYDVNFLLRTDTTQSVAAVNTPFANSAGHNVVISTVSGTTTVTISGITAASVTASNLKSLYVASIVAKAQPGQTVTTDSAPGLSTFWDAALAIYLQIGSHTLTLTLDTSSIGGGGGTGGIYRLPVSPTSPLVLTYADVTNFVNTVSAELTRLGAGTIPQIPSSFPNNAAISSFTLTLKQLAIDTKRKLFALSVTADLNYPVFSGLTVQRVGLVVKCSNGQDEL